ncbi:flavodoxin family protein [Marinibactrum halimedae]|uniref:Flavodoxin n=1 Tax=Marinibactrum halimedae TaxID=1444977 RepID=A0AA37T5V3_9GAMM|nr:NAD(P)H-dependent oxidoreductase [Marinibactrum halimedae]MCD9460545.1 NAD(P)H-dependent oxidoreductase [Marinibactrum halimedae]GLS27908.1 flavodoxin [Marinibactrum halimedae]
MKSLLVVAHAPSANTHSMVQAVLKGAQHEDIDSITTQWIPPLEATPEDVLRCDGIILGTTENLGYMSGALKDFFDRIYYPCLEEKQGLPCSLYIRAGHDGTGTQRALKTILTGLRWNSVQAPLVCRGDWQPEFLEQCQTLGLTMAAGMDAGVF